jgi:hypothetical protein
MTVYLLEANIPSVIQKNASYIIVWFSHKEKCQQFESHEDSCLAYLFHKLSKNDKPQHGFVQVIMTVGVNSRAVPVQGLHMNINILYHLLLWTQSNQYSRTWVVYISVGKLRLQMFELSNLDMDTQNYFFKAWSTQVWRT